MKKILAKKSTSLFQISFDFLAFFISFILQYVLVFNSGWFTPSIIPDIETAVTASFALSFYWMFVFWLFGLYKNWYIRSPFDEFFNILKASAFGCVFLLLAIFADGSKPPRMMSFIYGIIFTVLVALGRSCARRLQQNFRKKSIIKLTTLLIGSTSKIDKALAEIEKHPAFGYSVVGTIITDCDEETPKFENYIKVNDYNQVVAQLDNFNPYQIILCSNSYEHDTLMDLLSQADERGILFKISPDLYYNFTGLTKTFPIYNSPFLEISQKLLEPWEELLKRSFDIIFSSLVLLIGSPLWLLISILIKLDSPGSVVYKQDRVGKDGKSFKIYKFRSMRQTPLSSLDSWTVVNDPRVTKFGRFLRKSHLDEILQFYNVIKGDMSIVGPRPEQVSFVEKFSQKFPLYSRRLKVRPGITGWWQVQYTVYEESDDEINYRIKKDFYYIENMSFKLDIEIIIRTVFAVLKGHGQA